MRLFLLIILATIHLDEANSSEFQVKDQQNWYAEEKGSLNSNTDDQLEIQIDQSSPNYSKLISISRQMTMTEQMIKLYQERLEILKRLKEQIQKAQFEKNDKQSSSEDKEKNQIVTRQGNEEKQTKEVRNEMEKHKKVESDSPFLVLLNQYQITQANSNEANFIRKIQQKVTIIPPFIIDKEKSCITLISKIRKSTIGDQEEHSPYNYVYGHSSNRLLFYWLDKAPSQKSQTADQSSNQQRQTYTLNLALQIKPNKIKSVRIVYTTEVDSFQGGFIVEEQVTSYQSHELIDQSFKWHNALDFDNMLVGFRGSLVLIKSKDKRMHEIDVESKIMQVQSINQFKLLVICEDKIITVNVRSFLIMDEIRYAHFLGNRTLIQRKQVQKQRSSSEDSDQQETQEDEYLRQRQAFWQSNFTKQYERVRAVAYHYIEATKQFVILLSNSDLLLYSNEKIIGSSNFGNQLSKELSFDKLPKKTLNQILSSVRITIDMLPSYRHILIHSNCHSKILAFNVTIPGLTQQKSGNSELSFFSSSQRATELTSKFWISIPLSNDNPKQNILNSPILIKLFLVFHQSRFPTLNGVDQKSLIIFSAFTENLSQNGLDQAELQQANKEDMNTLKIKIRQYRVLINLFDNLSTENLTQGLSEGRSYWWNVFMVLMIVLGVVIFKKCKGSTQKPKEQFDFESQPKISRSKQQSGIPNRKKPIPKNMQESQQFSQNYNDKIISELQSYLEKQGKKLTKQQIVHLMQDLEEQEETQQKPLNKPQMKMEQNIDQFKEELDLMSKQQNIKNSSRSSDDSSKGRRNEEAFKSRKKNQ